MGDRANVVLKCRNEQIALYTHWNGSELPEILRQAMIRGKDRWNDYPYLNRIIFSEMIQYDVMNTTGFGISQHAYDGRDIIVEVDDQTVGLSGNVYSFTEYIGEERKWNDEDDD